MIITEPREVLRTHLKSGSTHYMTRRATAGIVVLKGRMDFVFSDTAIYCDRGHGIFLPQGASYEIRCYECSENLLFNFTVAEPQASPMSLEVSEYRVVENIFVEAEREFLCTHRSQNKLFSLFYQILSELFDKKTCSEKGERYVVLAEKIIIEGFSNPALSCASVASDINVSEVYLRKLFKRGLGQRPIKNLKMTQGFFRTSFAWT